MTCHKGAALKGKAAAVSQHVREVSKLQSKAQEILLSNKTGRSVMGLLGNAAGNGPALRMHEGWYCINDRNRSSCLDRKILFGLHVNSSHGIIQNLPTIRSKNSLDIAYFGVNLQALSFFKSSHFALEKLFAVPLRR